MRIRYFIGSHEVGPNRREGIVAFALHPLAAAFDLEDAYAKAFFAADAAKAVPKIHQPLFDAIHEEGALPRSNVTVEELGTWLAKHGLNRARMVASMQSKEVAERMARAQAFAVANRVGGSSTASMWSAHARSKSACGL